MVNGEPQQSEDSCLLQRIIENNREASEIPLQSRHVRSRRSGTRDERHDQFSGGLTQNYHCHNEAREGP